MKNIKQSVNNSKIRRLRLLHSGDLSDCAFIVGEDTEPSNEANEHNDNEDANCGDDETDKKRIFRCHKMVLATASEVFERMFYGGFTEQPSPIPMLDLTPVSFEVFLKYIYTCDINPSHVTIQNLPELLYIGEKYMMHDFIDVCIEIFQKQHFVLENTFTIFELGCLYKNEILLSISRKKMHEYGLILFQDPSFYNLNIDYVKPLMEFATKLKIIHANELLIALEQYEKKNNGNEGRKSEMFSKLVDAACSLDFGNMSSFEYSCGPANSHLFA